MKITNSKEGFLQCEIISISRMNEFAQSLHYEQGVTQGQFLSGLQLLWNQSDVVPRLKKPVCPTIYP